MKFKERVITTVTGKDSSGKVIRPEKVVEDKVRVVYQDKNGILRINYLGGKRKVSRENGVLYFRNIFTKIESSNVLEMLKGGKIGSVTMLNVKKV